ncbi:hypothetical protein EG68_08570 [Paragonimus skrjabini miyazakii]|uniref:Large ribosomal subunit protein mL37 n=1 Tax=Paragonimus skrjabini miyazakii TaxID=59628 RepID=A0A8S9YGP7_9TREM|nr:hypothetical protein EG68_08570 [Paragonimus skrjabini miyazakii]
MSIVFHARVNVSSATFDSIHNNARILSCMHSIFRLPQELYHGCRLSARLHQSICGIMRLTALLCRGKRIHRDKLEYLCKQSWRRRVSLLQVDRLRVPERVLANPNHPIHQAEDMFTSTRHEEALAEEIEMGVSPKVASEIRSEKAQRLTPWLPHANDPRYHPTAEPSLMYSNRRRFTKGLEQASLLTNTVVLSGFPSVLANLSTKIHSYILGPGLSETDRLTQAGRSDLRAAVGRAVLHAHVWHTDETKLPRRFCPELPIWKHKAEFGIHPQQATRYLFQNLFRILERQVPNFSELSNESASSEFSEMPSRWTSRDRFLETYYHFGNPGRRIGFAEQHDLVIHGRDPLPAFVPDPVQVHELCLANPPPVTCLGPMSPLIDFQSTRYYREDSTDEADPVRPEQRQAAAVMHCFASAIAHAYSRGLREGHLLETPICLHAICSDGVYFDFVHFQLNTLQFPDPATQLNDANAVRNLAWVDGNHRLFDKQVPRRSMLRNTKYRDLDMTVFSRLAEWQPADPPAMDKIRELAS